VEIPAMTQNEEPRLWNGKDAPFPISHDGSPFCRIGNTMQLIFVIITIFSIKSRANAWFPLGFKV
jgi:hypothetical protein